MAQGSQAGLALLYQIEGVENFCPYHAARADLLRRSGQREDAVDAYEQALALYQNSAEQTCLQRRLDEWMKP